MRRHAGIALPPNLQMKGIGPFRRFQAVRCVRGQLRSLADRFGFLAVEGKRPTLFLGRIRVVAGSAVLITTFASVLLSGLTGTDLSAQLAIDVLSETNAGVDE
jgi:hypothetical protein